MISIKAIENAFQSAYLKRSRSGLMLLIPIIIVSAMQIMMFIGHEALLAFAAAILSIVAVILRRVLMASESYIKKKIVHALHDTKQSDIFFASIENEMQHPSLQTYAEKGRQIYIFVTQNWLILASPNGCLVCMVRDIKEISVDFQKSRSKFRLKLDFFDGGSFFCAYERLYEPLVELINKRRGVGL